LFGCQQLVLEILPFPTSSQTTTKHKSPTTKPYSLCANALHWKKDNKKNNLRNYLLLKIFTICKKICKKKIWFSTNRKFFDFLIIFNNLIVKWFYHFLTIFANFENYSFLRAKKQDDNYKIDKFSIFRQTLIVW